MSGSHTVLVVTCRYVAQTTLAILVKLKIYSVPVCKFCSHCRHSLVVYWSHRLSWCGVAVYLHVLQPHRN